MRTGFSCSVTTHKNIMDVLSELQLCVVYDLSSADRNIKIFNINLKQETYFRDTFTGQVGGKHTNLFRI